MATPIRPKVGRLVHLAPYVALMGYVLGAIMIITLTTYVNVNLIGTDWQAGKKLTWLTIGCSAGVIVEFSCLIVVNLTMSNWLTSAYWRWIDLGLKVLAGAMLLTTMICTSVASAEATRLCQGCAWRTVTRPSLKDPILIEHFGKEETGRSSGGWESKPDCSAVLLLAPSTIFAAALFIVTIADLMTPVIIRLQQRFRGETEGKTPDEPEPTESETEGESSEEENPSEEENQPEEETTAEGENRQEETSAESQPVEETSAEEQNRQNEEKKIV